jgi:ubiquinone/menaquinone biosynthesis C-methylase UbiE
MSHNQNGHHHAGKSSRFFMEAEPVLDLLGISKGSTFLDAGCGDGFFTIAASSFVGAEGKIFAVDIFDEALDALRAELKDRKIGNVEVIKANLTKELPVEEGSVDFCLMANLLHGFVENREEEEVFRSLNRVLKKGGALAVVEFKKVESHGPPLEVRLTPEETEAVVEMFDYKRRLKRDVGEFHYAMRFIKK